MLMRKFCCVGGFAVAMAYVEAAVVVYLRRLYGIADLVRDSPPFDPFIALTEVGREVATLLMLLAVGWAVGRTLPARLGFALVAFGVWDIFYYAWLKLLLGWPESLLTPDVLFLIPVPWWGPVLAPMLVAGLAVAGGTLTLLREEQGAAMRLGSLQWAVLGSGSLALLYTFMADALAALPASPADLQRLRPTGFNWPVYLLGFGAISWSLWSATRPRAAGKSPR